MTRFLPPTSTMYDPLDSAFAALVERMQSGPLIPGVTMTTHRCSSGPDVSFVESLCGSVHGIDFNLCAGRQQGRLADSRDWNDIGALYSATIGKRAIYLYGDASGPMMFQYVGTTWKADRAAWLRSAYGVNARLHGEPRCYLIYKGSASPDGGYSYVGQVTRYLVHDNDLGRAYDLEPGDLPYYILGDVLAEMAAQVRAITEAQ